VAIKVGLGGVDLNGGVMMLKLWRGWSGDLLERNLFYYHDGAAPATIRRAKTIKEHRY
jgi:hypothetical protein